MSTLLIENLTKRYGKDIVAVDNLSFSAINNEFIVILGASGCGKTTLLNMIAGLIDATSGNIIIDDKNVDRISARDRNIAMVFQDYALYPHMTVYENLAFPLKMKRLSKNEIKEKVYSIADTLGLSDHLKQKPRNLSGGQQQRVAIGRALVRNPNIFLFDEPLSNLDASLRDKMRRELIDLHHSVKTLFIYVTHDQNEAMIMGDRIFIMDKGKIIQDGTPEQIYLTPNNIFVAEFIGSPKINKVSSELMHSILPETSLKYDDAIIGVRPEHIYLSVESYKDSARAKIKSVSNLGKDTIYYVTIDDHEFCIIKQNNEQLLFEKDETVYCNFDISSFIYFSKETGERL